MDLHTKDQQRQDEHYSTVWNGASKRITSRPNSGWAKLYQYSTTNAVSKQISPYNHILFTTTVSSST